MKTAAVLPLIAVLTVNGANFRPNPAQQQLPDDDLFRTALDEYPVFRPPVDPEPIVDPAPIPADFNDGPQPAIEPFKGKALDEYFVKPATLPNEHPIIFDPPRIPLEPGPVIFHPTKPIDEPEFGTNPVPLKDKIEEVELWRTAIDEYPTFRPVDPQPIIDPAPVPEDFDPTPVAEPFKGKALDEYFVEPVAVDPMPPVKVICHMPPPPEVFEDEGNDERIPEDHLPLEIEDGSAIASF